MTAKRTGAARVRAVNDNRNLELTIAGSPTISPEVARLVREAIDEQRRKEQG